MSEDYAERLGALEKAAAVETELCAMVRDRRSLQTYYIQLTKTAVCERLRMA
jgi:hypothetical protein